MEIQKEHVIELLTEFDKLNGVSGFEDEVRAHLCKALKPYAPKQMVDGLGNCICVKEGKNPDFKIMLSAHMDEIGFIIHEIEDCGYLRFVPVGMHNPNMLVNQVVTIYSSKGEIKAVVCGGKPIHQHKDTNNGDFGFKDLKLDVGACSKAEVLEMGIDIGDVANIQRDPLVFPNDNFVGKAVDNRSGCVAMILAMELLKDVETEASIYCCGTTQEEIGIKGAKVAARTVQPQIALAIDVGIGAEDNAVNPNGSLSFLGKGPGIQLYDWNPTSCLGVVVPKAMREALFASAQRAGIIPQKQVVLCCGTDATEISISNTGVLSGGISIPEKYIHTTVGMININDVIGGAKIIAEFVSSVKSVDSLSPSLSL